MQATPPQIHNTLTRSIDEIDAQALNPQALQPESYRLAFDDPEFMSRKETRGLRFQLELLKPELEQEARGIHQTVVVFGGARVADAKTAQAELEAAQRSGDAAALARAQRMVRNARYYESARAFAHLVSRACESEPVPQRFVICTGGGPGIMEAANRGAYEAGALNVGLNITLPHEQSGNRFITPGLSFKFHYFALRKMHLLMRAKALVVFPGGFGTLDELFEVLTLVQTGKAKRVPIILFGSEYWKRLVHFEVLVEEGMISPEDLELFHYCDEPEQAWELLRRFYANGRAA
ncbi:TIGR00730 family Rossman fold protein [Vandammella animalimorsus]|uniref:Cytokinin riboside 5'-monophosphate phosphoribohydrolase n=1 Tax=Vandammella animalimorsus TaxID=2029117 RepID=A0A2A2A8U2_9BURK|nr:TIGR00730 family Rossman fold protein [Vandammella animalimorsus]PAT34158.1 TIGR00730 family Rossman fold protein [Vandammella animalimorsus]